MMHRDHSAKHSRRYWQRVAKQEMQKEWFMVPRTRRAYWGELGDRLDGPLCLMSRYLRSKCGDLLAKSKECNT